MANGDLPFDESALAPLRAIIGQEEAPLRLVDSIAAADLRRYANAIDDRNPLWHDDDYAQRAGYPGPIAPPCLLLEFTRPATGHDQVGASGLSELFGAVAWGLPVEIPTEFSSVRRGEDTIEWIAPALPGDCITLRQRIADVQLKSGHTGLLLLVGQAKDYWNQRGELLVRQRITTIRRWTVPGKSPPPRREPPIRPLPVAPPASKAPSTSTTAVGDSLPPLHFGPLSVVHTVRWAAFTENWYRLHYDREYVQVHEGERSFIASGGFRQALVCRMLTDWLGRDGRLLQLTLRQAYPTFEGDRFLCGER